MTFNSCQLGLSPIASKGIAIGLNFIPGVGPILSGIFSIATSLFGGGDPTPIWELESAVLKIREQISELHEKLGVPDDWKLAGPIGSGMNLDMLRKAVTEGNGHSVQSGDWRKGLYTAIHAFQDEAGQLAQQSHDVDLIAQFKASQAAMQNAVATDPEVPNNTLSGDDHMPLILAGASILVVLLLFSQERTDL